MCLGSACSVWTTLGLPQLAECAFQVYTAQAPGCSAGAPSKAGPAFVHFPGLSRSGSGSPILCKGTDLVGHVFCALPRSEQLRQLVLGKCFDSGGPCILITSLVPAAQFPGCAACLLWAVDLRLWPSWQMSTVWDPRKVWLATGSLLTVWLRMLVSGAEPAPCLQALAVSRLPLCLLHGGGAHTQQDSSPLLFT